jgi:hypothetical protein
VCWWKKPISHFLHLLAISARRARCVFWGEFGFFGPAPPYNAAVMTHLPRSIPLHLMFTAPDVCQAHRAGRIWFGAVSGDEVIAFRYTDEAASRRPLDPPSVDGGGHRPHNDYRNPVL